MLPERNHSVAESVAEDLTDRFVQMETNEPQEYRFHNVQVQNLVNQQDAAIFSAAMGVDAQGNRCLILSVLDEDAKMIGTTRLELSFPYP